MGEARVVELQQGHVEKKLITKAYQTFLIFLGLNQGFIIAITFTLQASSHPPEDPNLHVQRGAGDHCWEPGFTPVCLLHIHILGGTQELLPLHSFVE